MRTQRFWMVFFVLASLALACIPAHAQRAATITGLGGYGCGKYLEHRKSANNTQDGVYVNWVWGYLSGYNVFSTHREVEIPERSAVLAYLDKYCRD